MNSQSLIQPTVSDINLKCSQEAVLKQFGTLLHYMHNLKLFNQREPS